MNAPSALELGLEELDPAALALAFGDWALHLAASPGKLVELQRKAARKWLRYGTWMTQAMQGKTCATCIEPLEQDSRFRAEAWQQWPFNASPAADDADACHAAILERAPPRQLIEVKGPPGPGDGPGLSWINTREWRCATITPGFATSPPHPVDPLKARHELRFFLSVTPSAAFGFAKGKSAPINAVEATFLRERDGASHRRASVARFTMKPRWRSPAGTTISAVRL